MKVSLTRIAARAQFRGVESLLNELGRRGLRVWQNDSNRWVCEWRGSTVIAGELGTAIFGCVARQLRLTNGLPLDDCEEVSA